MSLDGYSYRANRVSTYPHDMGKLGHYVAAPSTGTMSAGLPSSSDIVQFRWANSSAEAVIYSIRITGLRCSTAFAVGDIDFTLQFARTWTADGSGGATVSTSGDRQKLDTRFGTSLVGGFRIATTTTLANGTRALDLTPLGEAKTHSSGGVSSAIPIIGNILVPNPILFKANVANGESPIILSASEGFVIKATVPGTGVWQVGFEIKWAERQVGLVDVA